ncbi:MAG TPA: phospholipid carrier-dependent glycosyltransferase [Anaerolineaceae bacterium]
MTGWRITREQLWYALAFCIALILRLAALGTAPLSDPEAQLALQSLAISRGTHAVLSGQPGGLLVSSALFFLLGSSNFAARLWPALAGSLLVLAPLGLRRWLGGRAALALAFFLALDPGLVALSRQVGSPLPAIAFSLLAIGFWQAKKPVWTGIAAGLALLGGPQVWNGLLGIGAALAVTWLLDRIGPAQASDASPAEVEPVDASGACFAWPAAGLALAMTLAAVGTLFWLAPEGLSALGASLSAYFGTWVTGSGIPAVRLLQALAGDEFLFVSLAIWGLWRGLRGRSRLDAVLGIWFLAALALAALPTGRQVESLGWALIPLLGLAARGVAEIPFGEEDHERIPTWVYTAAVAGILGFTWLSLTAMLLAWQQGDPKLILETSLRIGGGVILLASATFLVGWGWSAHVAGQGALRGLLLALVIYQLSAATAAAGWRLTPPAEVWDSAPRPQAAQFLGETVQDLSRWRTGDARTLDLVVLGEQAPSLAWYLRDMTAAQMTLQLAKTASPSLVITPQQDQPPQLAATYRGQSFAWDTSPDWGAMSAQAWVNWAVFRTAPLREDAIILWARTDVFLGANLSPTGP